MKGIKWVNRTDWRIIFIFGLIVVLTGCGSDIIGGKKHKKKNEKIVCSSNSTSPGCANPNPVTPNPAIENTSSYAASKTSVWVDRGHYSTGFTQATAYADFTGDGITDMVIASGNGTANPTPIKIFKGDGACNYNDVTADVIAGEIPGCVHPRKAIIADFNGDGRPDIYIADHGYDQPPYPGYHNTLLLSTPDGRLQYVKDHEDYIGFHHCATAADFNNNGTVDIFSCRDAAILINDGTGHFTPDSSLVPPFLNVSDGFYTAEFMDIDKDGYIDLIVGGHEFEGAATRILWGSASGKYTESLQTMLPGDNEYSIVLDIDAEDIDGDGNREIVITRTRGNPFYSGYYFQILKQNGMRSFTDESTQRIIGDRQTWIGSNAKWIDWVRLVDYNKDGFLDIVADDKSRSLVWLNDGKGNFKRDNPDIVIFPDPDTIPVGTSKLTSVTAQKPIAELSGVAIISFSQADAEQNPTITVTKGQDPQSAQIFADVKTELEITGGADYEVTISSTFAPTADSPVVLGVPESVATKIGTGQGLVVYYEVPEGEEEPAAYLPLESTYNTSTKTISATIPTFAYQDQGNGTYQAKLKIGVANGYNSNSILKRAAVLAKAPPSGNVVNNYILPQVDCPLSLDCTEVSPFQPNRNGKPHAGIDLRAEFVPVFSRENGKVTKVVDFYEHPNKCGSYIIIKDDENGSQKYCHMSIIDLSLNQEVHVGDEIGVSGDTSTDPINPHLHFELIYPNSKSCVIDATNVINCLFFRDNVDPFPSLLQKAQIVQVPNPPIQTLTVNNRLQLALIGIEPNLPATTVSSDVSADPGNLERRVEWTVTDPAGITKVVDPYQAETDTDSFSFEPETEPGNLSSPGKLNQGTFTPKKGGHYTISAKWQYTSLTATYDLDVDLDAPTGLTATTGEQEVTLNWNPVTNAASYNIYYSTTSGVTKSNGTPITNVIGNSYTVKNLTNGTKYYFVVTAVNGSAESKESNEVSAMPTKYTDNPNGTITDNVTGLIWQKQDDGVGKTWYAAITYCDTLVLGGQTGWRLPSLIELMSIVDYGVHSPPFINTTYFQGSISSHYWSSTTPAIYTSNAWYVYFYGGSKNHNPKTDTYYVRCVRGGQ